MRPAEIVKEGRLDSRPCLFSGTANPSDVCQVHSFMSLICNIVVVCPLHFLLNLCFLSNASLVVQLFVISVYLPI